MKKKIWLGMGLLALIGAYGASASGIFTNGVPPAGGTQYPTTLPLTGNELIPADTQLPSGQNPQSEAISVSQLAGFATPASEPKNYLSNAAMAVASAGTGVLPGGTTTLSYANRIADRWFVDTNVGSGAGAGQVVTASPAPLAGFQNSIKVYRASGALTQPVCAIQEIETARATQLQGKNVVFSTYLQALAGLTSTNSVVTMSVITGTGTDQGLGGLTASPAITPAWTNISTVAAVPQTLTTSWVRYSTGAVAIPATATEVGVQICFTPVGSASGTTDGFALVGAQLEVVTGANTAPSAFEFRLYQDDLKDAQRYTLTVNEPASGVPLPGFCEATGATAGICQYQLPVPMRGTPTVSITVAGTFKLNIAGTATTWVTPAASTCSIYACTITTANTNTAGQFELWTGGGGSGIVNILADVVM